MKVLVIGLGSMGKRRIRNLFANNIHDITGFDLRTDRISEASNLYNIKVSSSLDEIIKGEKFDCWIISVPPDLHHIYVKLAIDFQVPCFVEASVVDDEMDKLIIRSDSEKIFVAPSCTLLFHPAIKKIREILQSEMLGTISNVTYISGQYLPDWHLYESPSEYYVSNPLTGGAREIVPFELTWITNLFGFPIHVAGINKKTINIEGAEQIDDTYNLLMDYSGFTFSLNVDVVSRFATRRLLINGSNMQLYWEWNDNNIQIFDPNESKWKIISYDLIDAESGYNKNISEQMYNEEIKAFLDRVRLNVEYPNSLQNDLKILKLLYSAEESFKYKRFVEL